MKNIRFGLTLLAITGIFTASFAWRSALYPENWQAGSVYDNKFLHDFSYAGYERGEKEIPTSVPGKAVYDVTQAPYNADKTGVNDATVAIQNAINAAQSAGGGVVYLPAGTYKVRPQGSNSYALQITGSNILFKGDGIGKTFIRCYAESMRNQSIILVGQGGNWGSGTNPTNITEDIPDRPTSQIKVQDASAYNVGDWIILRSDRTAAWVSDHNMSGFWNANTGTVGLGTVFYRQITAKSGNTITIDIPTRYWMKTRDAARIYKTPARTVNTGIQDFSIGNKQNPSTSGWGEEDYNTLGTGAYQVHGAFLIKFSGVVNGWAKNIASYQAENSQQVHMVSNGLDINQSRSLTIDRCDFSHPQYEGGGGNGYGMNICASDLLISNCSSTSARHSYSFKYTYSNGSVIYNFTSNSAKYASDFHMYLSMSNLIDNQNLNRDFIESNVRPYGGTAGNYHGYTSTQTVFWNTNGVAGPGGNNSARIIDSRQYGYGYIIGTRGAAPNVSTTPTTMNSSYGSVNTSPEDHKEGIGTGGTLEPQSLYHDQLKRRLGNSTVARDSTAINIPGTFNSTKYVGKSNEVADNGNYVGNLINNSYMDYVIDVKQAGNYRIVLNTARSGDAARAVTVSTGNVNGSNLSNKGSVTIPAGSDWFAFSPVVSAASFNLTAGKQLLRLASNGSVNIENITLGMPIDIPGTFSSTQFLNKSSEISVNEKQYLGNLVAGSYAEYLVNVATAGEYGISLNTATGNNNNQRAITVFSGANALTTLQVINGTDWEAFSAISARIQLSAGVQILRLVSSGAVNIEKITIAAPKTEGDTVVVLNIPEEGYEYDKQAKTPEVSSVSIGAAKLAPGTDYDVSYLNNTNAGAATVRVTGKGNYVGLVRNVQFMIVKKQILFTFQDKPMTIDLSAESWSYPISVSGLIIGAGEKVFTLRKGGGEESLSVNDILGKIIVECDYGKGGEDGGSGPGIYPITIRVDGELTADNYVAVFDDGLTLVVIDPNESSIKSKTVKDKKQGIIINPNPVTAGEKAVAKFKIKTLKTAYVSITIYDNVGNAVYKSGKGVKTDSENIATILWNLKNNAGRFVANGSYLVVAEVKIAGAGNVIYYSEVLGVKK